MRQVVILGVGIHPFGRFLDKGLSDLAKVAIWDALKDANVPAKDIQVAYLGNSIGGLITGQEGIRAQTVLGPCGFGVSRWSMSRMLVQVPQQLSEAFG